MERIGKQNRIFGLDLMRALAILMVLIGHCSWIFHDGNGIAAALLALSSFMGVEFFFVLSGFLIGRILYRQFTQEPFGLHSVFAFLKRRWFRTFPNYFLILPVNIAVAYGVGSTTESWWRYFVFLQNFASPMRPFFTESWSLSVEEFAYLILPFSLLVLGFLLRPKNKRAFFMAGVFLLTLVFIMTKCVYHSRVGATSIDVWNLAVKSVVIYRLDSIFIGVIAGWLYDNHGHFLRKTKMLWTLLGLAMMGFFTFGVGWFGLFIDTHPFFWNVVYLPLVSVSIAFFLPFLAEWKSAVPAISKPVTFVSLISYSIYLLHYSVVLQALKYFFDTDTFAASWALVFTFGYVALTILLSYMLYRFYEKPMMDWRDKV